MLRFLKGLRIQENTYLYRQLKRQVKRNIERFPNDFMFEMTKEEYDSIRSQFGTLKRGEHSKYLPSTGRTRQRFR